ncbi:MAG TPA: Yip1 family protein [Methanocorpusculum sp.]|nr:Yip1 family protein [Methanocorpusculum sp.]
MNIKNAVNNLLFDQKQFFAGAPKGLLIPVLLTLLYSLVSIIFILPGDALTAMIVIISSVIGTLVSWAVVAAMFFAGVKLIAHAKCSFKQVFTVIGYASAILAIGAVLSGLIGLIGTPDPLATLALQGAILFWCIPVWIYGIASITDLEPKKVLTCIIVPIIVMVIVTLMSFASTPLVINTMDESMSSMSSARPTSSSGSGFRMMR